MTNSFAFSVVLRALLLAACMAGTLHAVFHKRDESEDMGGIWYYTIQSNLWVLLMTAVYLVLSIVTQYTGAPVTFRALEIARYAILTGITVTFLVFWLILAPMMEKEYLKSLNNLLVHTLVPLLFIADFFLFDRIGQISAVEALWCVAMPLYYCVLTFTHAAVRPNIRFEEKSRYPYFFMDADQLGWFKLQKMPGVFWWMLLTLGLTLGLGYLYRFVLSLV